MKKNPHMNERVKKYQNKRGIQYATADGALYKALKILYIIAFAVNILFNVFYILVKLVSLGAENSQSSDISGLIQISVFTAALIAGFVLTVIHRTRWVGRIISMAALAASAIALAVITAGSGSAQDINEMMIGSIQLHLPLYFYLRHGLPAFIGFVLLALMTLIDILSRTRYNRLYRRLENELYAQYLAQTAAPTDEGWQQFLAGEPEIISEQIVIAEETED